ncbi:hypothetical protein BU23DRAFT_183352 [Bimuria novae-zelandiae CBS 107.79]|uniref:Zn(2)-C6 fungal-type domain-containing protein n=1 Tax=Bimuria novae-zelandiae CBS 107.79 TaxID=1447943 RepID=A0A6A5V384_9PLEO|nr:hypothetical protein BU23DRAFT_183352 [Bimuria novae-zelandiae CBS 107.79]
MTHFRSMHSVRRRDAGYVNLSIANKSGSISRTSTKHHSSFLARPPAKIMRQRSGCNACRERHIKCVKLRDSDQCKYCAERKRPCIRGNAYRFRPVTAVKFNAGEDLGSAEQSLEFGGSQTWVTIPPSLRFVAPNTNGHEEIVEDETEQQPESASEGSDPALQQLLEESLETKSPIDPLLAFHQRNSSQPLGTSDSHGSQDIGGIIDYHQAPFLPPISNVSSSHTPLARDVVTDNPSQPHHGTPFARTDSENLLGGAADWSVISPENKHNSPSLSTKRSPNNVSNISPFSNSAFSPNSSLSLRWPVNNPFEARLFHHYIVACSDWIDVCDSRRHFTREVPKRAAHFPVILNAILGLAARHLWLIEKLEEDRSQLYVDQCLQSLIMALEDPLAHWDENFLVAVILLRLHEEIGQDDEQCHHFGTARILNSISSFAADGGLRESASWVSLRQHIYVSLTKQQPFNLSLENYKHSCVFREFDDEAWANRIVYQFALILQYVFEETEHATTLTRDKWSELNADTEEWHRTKPWSFAPLYSDPKAGDTFDGTWPVLPAPQGVVAIGLQYYHLCKILLTIYSPNASLVGLAGVRARKSTDAAIRKNMRIVIGYGVSNSHCSNVMFQGSHILSACGAYITDKAEQQACVEYLDSLQRMIGWRTDKVVAEVREQWEN